MAEKTVPESKVPARTGNEGPVATRETRRFLKPAVDIYETNDGLEVVADMPGVRKDDLDIQVEDGVLTILANTTLEGRKNPLSEEYRLFNYFRQFRLNGDVDMDKIKAEIKHGVVTIHLPKAEKVKPKRIEVRVS